MGDIAKGVLGGGWSLLVGWILPTAINLGIIAIAIAPSLRNVPVMDQVYLASTSTKTLLLLTCAVLLGLVLSALQNPLYRILEGYLLWPPRLYVRCSRRHRERRNDLTDRLMEMRQARRAESEAALSPEAARNRQRQATPAIPGARRRPNHQRTATQQALLAERLARYPVDDDQITPTRLGNAIRRLEEYGHDRYRLDSQVLWNELTATAPEQARRQVDIARTSVDFFIALLYGHAVLIVVAISAISASSADVPTLLGTAVSLSAAVPLWYRAAVIATDEWAAAVRALINLGRQPLARAMGLTLPQDIQEEREMWRMVSRLSRTRFHERAAALNRYRRPFGGDEPPV
ncbi:hypothetical protein [Streptomyces sp. NPDC003720]|uniref:hypothetical protein n=1 Tax=Streptomyces sp. NPDC003720 TaxID=3364684 RepID=UPI0036B09373